MFPCAVDEDEVSWFVHDPVTTTSVLQSKEAMNERRELDEAPVQKWFKNVCIAIAGIAKSVFCA